MSKISLSLGSIVYYDNEQFTISSHVDLDSVLAENTHTGQKKVLFINKLQSGPDEPRNPINIYNLDDKEWKKAQKKFQIISPVLSMGKGRSNVEKAAKTNKIDSSTIYRWIKQYEATGTISSLVPKFAARGGKGKPRTNPTTEEIIQEAIATLYLTKQRLPVRKVYLEVREKCAQANVPIPNEKTVRNRINQISQRKTTKARFGHKAYSSIFEKAEGVFPEGKYPLDVIQIDHTPLDIIIVDEIYREPVGRPYITLAIDVFSRVVFGFYISLDHPSFFTVGQTLLQGILPKGGYKKSLAIEGEWNVWGIPRVIHVDNAMEFRGKNLQRFCEEYGITLSWRPVARPQFGGHIERLVGTLGKELHSAPGTTFSNIQERGDYNSEGEAIMTLSECEQWIANLIINIYHQRVHSALGMSPIEKFEKGLLGDENSPGVGLPDIIEDSERLRVSLLPAFSRSIQRDGISIEGITYYSDVLRRWINEVDPETNQKNMFQICRDPRDISVVFFFDPEIKEYFPIPYRNISLPPISIWELKKVKEFLSSKHIPKPDEHQIFQAYETLHQIEITAKEKTKAARKEHTKKTFHQKKKTEQAPNTRSPKEDYLDTLFSNPKPFGDIEIVNQERS